jgi:hypothetical protein
MEKTTEEILKENDTSMGTGNINPHSPGRRFTMYKRKQDFNMSMSEGDITKLPILGEPENV